MKTSEQLNDLIAALAKARGEFPAIVRNQTAIARGGREYQYADLSTIADATSGILAQHGLVLMQGIEDGVDGQLCISTTLYHTSGQWLQCALNVPKPASMQDVGAISTYLRRYQQSSVLNISTEDDDDAASTPGATTNPSKNAPAASVPNGHGTPPLTSAPTDHPTEAAITALSTLAVVECQEEPEVFAQRLRTMMGLKPSASVAPKLLTRTMLMAHYLEVLGYYQRLQQQLTRPNVYLEGNGQGPAAPATAISESADPPIEEASGGASSETAPLSSHGHHPPTSASLYATPQQLAALKRLAARVSAEAAADVQDVLDHSRNGLLQDVYQRIETRLQARLHGQKAIAVA